MQSNRPWRSSNRRPGSARPVYAGIESTDSEIEWCNRRLLAVFIASPSGRLRKEIEPVSSADFMRFLFAWQHVAPGTQLHGVDGTLQILKQLQGYEISAAAWESEVLQRRVAKYTPELLDRLCLSGEVMWGRLSPHPSLVLEDSDRVAGGFVRRGLRPSPYSCARMRHGCCRPFHRRSTFLNPAAKSWTRCDGAARHFFRS